jgi:hypothetical protein
MAVRFVAVEGKTYSLLYRDHVAAGTWHKVRDIPAQPFTRELEVPDPATVAFGDRFYRLVSPHTP